MAVTEARTVAELARELGMDGATDKVQREALTLLLNDEFERLAAGPRRVFAAGLGEERGVVVRCGRCGHLWLARFAPDDGCCRVCGQAGAEAGAEVATGPEQASPPRLIGPEIEPLSWELCRDRSLLVPFALAADNEDWERVEEAQAQARQSAQSEAERALELTRPMLGCVVGGRAGQTIPITNLPPAIPSDLTVVHVYSEREGRLQARLYVGEQPASVDDQACVLGSAVDLELGAVIQIEDEVFVIEEAREIESQVAVSLHFAREDGKPGGPWPYWNETLHLGAALKCEVRVVDDGVEDVHARVSTRFGRVVLEDLSGEDPEDGLRIDGERRSWVLLTPGRSFQLGERGPSLIVKEGDARIKPGEKARAMKPSRHKTTLLELRTGEGEVLRKVFVFTRRELRFGNRAFARRDPTRMINELVLAPGPDEAARVGEKQGALMLTREGVDLRRDDLTEMSLNDELLEAGHPRPLKRRFTVSVGKGITLEGRVYRSPSSVERDAGPARLGMRGGHDFECVRLDRRKTELSYVFLVRMLRIGGEPDAPLRIDATGVEKAHCQIMFSQGKFLIVAPRAEAPVWLGEVLMDPGVPFPLEIGTVIRLGQAELHFRVPEESDFLV